MATKPPYRGIVKIENLVLDEHNPRLPRPLPQDEAIVKFASEAKTLRLAEHIAAHGANPLDTIGVIPGDRRGRYVVKEGNRRVAALRLLRNPHLAGSDRLTARYRKIAKDADVPITGDVPVVVFPHAELLNDWILIKHAGESGGAGTVAWDAMEKARFNLRSGAVDQYTSAYRYLNDAVAKEWITEDEANNVNVSSLTRLLKDSGVREVLSGSETQTGEVQFALGGDGARNLARRLVHDWGRDGLTVRTIYRGSDRRQYAEALLIELALEVDPKRSGAATPAKRTPAKSGQPVTARRQRDRRCLVPRSFSISVPDELRRTRHLLREMQELDVHKYPNAAACLLRTFIETSVSHYIAKYKVSIHPREDRLGARTEKAIAHVRLKCPQGAAAVRPVKAALSKDFSIFSISTLHEYVHSPRWHPEPEDLLKHWDTYAAFLQCLWE